MQLREEEEKMGHSRDGFNMYGEMETMEKHRVNVGAQNESRDKEPDFYSSCQSMFVCVPLPMCACERFPKHCCFELQRRRGRRSHMGIVERRINSFHPN